MPSIENRRNTTYIVNLFDNISETLGQGLTLALEQTVACLGALELLLHDAQRPNWDCGRIDRREKKKKKTNGGV